MSVKIGKPTPQEIKANPREFALYSLLDKNKDSTLEVEVQSELAARSLPYSFTDHLDITAELLFAGTAGRRQAVRHQV